MEDSIGGAWWSVFRRRHARSEALAHADTELTWLSMVGPKDDAFPCLDDSGALPITSQPIDFILS
jgi:hypothetical protein